MLVYVCTWCINNFVKLCDFWILHVFPHIVNISNAHRLLMFTVNVLRKFVSTAKRITLFCNKTIKMSDTNTFGSFTFGSDADIQARFVDVKTDRFAFLTLKKKKNTNYRTKKHLRSLNVDIFRLIHILHCKILQKKKEKQQNTDTKEKFLLCCYPTVHWSLPMFVEKWISVELNFINLLKMKMAQPHRKFNSKQISGNNGKTYYKKKKRIFKYFINDRKLPLNIKCSCGLIEHRNNKMKRFSGRQHHRSFAHVPFANEKSFCK